MTFKRYQTLRRGGAWCGNENEKGRSSPLPNASPRPDVAVDTLQACDIDQEIWPVPNLACNDSRAKGKTHLRQACCLNSVPVVVVSTSKSCRHINIFALTAASMHMCGMYQVGRQSWKVRDRGEALFVRITVSRLSLHAEFVMADTSWTWMMVTRIRIRSLQGQHRLPVRCKKFLDRFLGINHLTWRNFAAARRNSVPNGAEHCQYFKRF